MMAFMRMELGDLRPGREAVGIQFLHLLSLDQRYTVSGLELPGELALQVVATVERCFAPIAHCNKGISSGNEEAYCNQSYSSFSNPPVTSQLDSPHSD